MSNTEHWRDKANRIERSHDDDPPRICYRCGTELPKDDELRQQLQGAVEALRAIVAYPSFFAAGVRAETERERMRGIAEDALAKLEEAA